MPEQTLPAILDHQAALYGNRPLLRVGNVTQTYEEMRHTAATMAGALAEAGVGKGDRVVFISENRWEMVAAWVGCAWLGAVFVPLNAAARGPQLQHLLMTSAPTVLAIEAEVIQHLARVTVTIPELKHVWLLDESAHTSFNGIRSEHFPPPGEPLEACTAHTGDTSVILFTSGTTGPSKGVCCSHGQFYWWGVNTASALGVHQEDVLYTCLPLFHTNALNTFIQALLSGARCVVGPRFSASRFWERVADVEATVTYLLGSMVSILAQRETPPADVTHHLRVALAPAVRSELHDLALNRFGVRLVEAHGMTETNLVVGPRQDEQRPGYMGRVMPGFHARVVDEEDNEVSDGTPGELVMRADEPFAFANGYWRMPEATVSAWRNLWFHSGDRVVREPDGYFRFLDRIGDSIRRRGENISAWEVEQVIESHPAVSAVAAIPVPSEHGEDDVMVCVVLCADSRLEPAELICFCKPRLAYFAVPRYIEFLGELPLTENGKVKKFILRERGVTGTTWDRERSDGTRPS